MPMPPLSRAPLSGSAAFFAVEYDPADAVLWLLDQRLLPGEERYVPHRTVDEAAHAIRAMVVRGAPAIGITAAYALAQRAALETGPAASFLMAMGISGRGLDATRPTAVNLGWAIARMARKAADVAALDPGARAKAMLAEAEAVHREDVAACRAMGALGVIRAAHAAGKIRRVLACETRPYLQGARLTSFELSRDGIPVEVITDSMAGWFMARGEVQLVVVGADRVAANGDVANKIGTYGLAVLAHAHGVPFTVAAPWSTVDLRCPDGRSIPIEERSRDEVATLGGVTLVAEGIPCRHPAFDVTPARLVGALYTERGALRPADGEGPAAFLARTRRAP